MIYFIHHDYTSFNLHHSGISILPLALIGIFCNFLTTLGLIQLSKISLDLFNQFSIKCGDGVYDPKYISGESIFRDIDPYEELNVTILYCPTENVEDKIITTYLPTGLFTGRLKIVSML